MVVIDDPKGWWLLAFLLLFFLILVRKMRRRTASLTTFFLLERLIKSTALPHRRLRILRRLAYLLFILGVGLISLAGFRPSWVSRQPPLTELAVVDLSPSLGARDGGETRAVAMRRLLEGYLRRLRPEDTLYLIAAGPQAVCLGPLRGTSREVLQLPELDHADAPPDVAAAVDQAGILLRRLPFNHLLLFSDRPERWMGLIGRPSLVPRPHVLTLGRPHANAGIVACDLRRDFFRSDSFDLFAAVEGLGTAARPLLEIRGNGKLLRTLPLAPSAGGRAEAEVTGLTLEPGVLELRLLPADAYPADNTVLAGISGQGTVRVKAATGTDSYLAKALAANPALAVTFLDPAGELPADDGAVHLFDGPVPPGSIPQRALFVQPAQPLEGLTYRATIGAVSRVAWDRTDPILRGIDLEELSLPDLFGFDESPSFREAATADGYPLILLGTDQRRHWAVLAFDPVRSNFVYTPSYPILVANLLRWLSAFMSEPRGFFTAGSRIGLPAAAAGGTAAGPTGARDIPIEDPGGEAGISALQAGRYRISGGDGAFLGECFVNVLNPAVTADIGAPGYGEGSSSLPSDLPRGPSRIDFAPWLILCSLLLLAGHAWLSRSQGSGVE